MSRSNEPADLRERNAQLLRLYIEAQRTAQRNEHHAKRELQSGALTKRDYQDRCYDSLGPVGDAYGKWAKHLHDKILSRVGENAKFKLLEIMHSIAPECGFAEERHEVLLPALGDIETAVETIAEILNVSFDDVTAAIRGEVPWRDEADGYVLISQALTLLKGERGVSIVPLVGEASRRLKPDSPIRHMRAPKRCKVQVNDFLEHRDIILGPKVASLDADLSAEAYDAGFRDGQEIITRG